MLELTEVVVGGLYALTSKRKGSKFTVVLRICKMDPTIDESKLDHFYIQDFATGNFVKYVLPDSDLKGFKTVPVPSGWNKFDVEYLGSDVRSILRYAYSSVADKL